MTASDRLRAASKYMYVYDEISISRHCEMSSKFNDFCVVFVGLSPTVSRRLRTPKSHTQSCLAEGLDRMFDAKLHFVPLYIEGLTLVFRLRSIFQLRYSESKLTAILTKIEGLVKQSERYNELRWQNSE